MLEKRSVFRSNKKFYQKDLFLENKKIKTIIYNKLPLEKKQKVIEMIRDFKICSPRSNPVSSRNRRRNAKKYVWLVGDPCYNYSREAKEVFFRQAECSFLFLLAKTFILEQYKSEKFSHKADIMVEIVEDLSSLAM